MHTESTTAAFEAHDRANRTLTEALAPIFGTHHARAKLARILTDVVAHVATEEGADATATATALGILSHLAQLADAHETSIPDAKGTRRFADALELSEGMRASPWACVRLAGHFARAVLDQSITVAPCVDTFFAAMVRSCMRDANVPTEAMAEDVLHHVAQSMH